MPSRSASGRRFVVWSAFVAACIVAVLGSRRWHVFVRAVAFERVAVNEGGFAEYRHRGTGLIFVEMQGGEKGQRFLIAKQPVPEEVWIRVLGSMPMTDEDGRAINEVYPADVDAFCEETGLRYPTTEEWKTAASSMPHSGVVVESQWFEWVRCPGKEPSVITLAGEPAMLNHDERVIAFRPAH